MRSPPSFDFDAYTATSFGVVAEPAVTVHIRFERSLASRAEEHSWHPSQKLEHNRVGSLDLRMQVGGTTELRNWVLSFGSAAEVLAPESLRAEVAGELQRALPLPGWGGNQRGPGSQSRRKAPRGDTREDCS